MTLKSVVSERYARWAETLFKHGYIIEKNPWMPTSAAAGTVGLRGRRRADLGAPQVVIDIAETWIEGPDPDGRTRATRLLSGRQRVARAAGGW